eukprot:4316799-Pyramimonas_sp.AAC.1
MHQAVVVLYHWRHTNDKSHIDIRRCFLKHTDDGMPQTAVALYQLRDTDEMPQAALGRSHLKDACDVPTVVPGWCYVEHTGDMHRSYRRHASWHTSGTT